MPPAARATDDVTNPRPDLNIADSQEISSPSGRPSAEEIAREAYLIYLGNGEREGNHEEDWHEAERRLAAREPRRKGDATPQQVDAQLSEMDATLRTPG